MKTCVGEVLGRQLVRVGSTDDWRVGMEVVGGKCGDRSSEKLGEGGQCGCAEGQVGRAEGNIPGAGASWEKK